MYTSLDAFLLIILMGTLISLLLGLGAWALARIGEKAEKEEAQRTLANPTH